MKVKNGHIITSTQFLKKINCEERSIKFAFHVSTIINRVTAAVKVIDEIRQKIINSAQDKDKDGNLMYYDDKKQYVKLTEDGNKQLDELMELESEIEIEQFSLEQLEAVGIKVQPMNVDAIKWMIKP